MKAPFALLLAAFLFFTSGCSETDPEYRLVYPIQASKQQVLRFDGVRFISTTDTPEFSLIVLGNPVTDASYVDIAFALTNGGDAVLELTPDMLTVRTKGGARPVADRDGYAARLAGGERYRRPEGFEKLMPKMQAFGCAAPKTEDNMDKADLTPSQKQVWKQYRDYHETGTLEADAYFTGFTLRPGETRSAFVRIDLPHVDAKAEREAMLFSLCPPNNDCKKIRLVIQPL